MEHEGKARHQNSMLFILVKSSCSTVKLVQIFTLPFIACMFLDELLNLSVSQFSQLVNKIVLTTYITCKDKMGENLNYLELFQT